MKMTIIHDRIHDGLFPEAKLTALGFNVTVEATKDFKQKVMIAIETDEDPMVLAYTIGRLVEISLIAQDS
jgi:hypothetical protein